LSFRRLEHWRGAKKAGRTINVIEGQDTDHRLLSGAEGWKDTIGDI
jgi:hypothetical protein